MGVKSVCCMYVCMYQYVTFYNKYIKIIEISSGQEVFFFPSNHTLPYVTLSSALPSTYKCWTTCTVDRGHFVRQISTELCLAAGLILYGCHGAGWEKKAVIM